MGGHNCLLGHHPVPTEALAVLVVEPVVLGVLGVDAVSVLALQEARV